MTITIINSKGYWQNGWLPDLETLNHFMAVLEQSDIHVEAFEVENVLELERLLSKLDPNENLLLPNAYHVNPQIGSSKLIWMGDIIDRFNFRAIGSDAKTLQNLLQKHICQQILKENGIPVPKFTFINPEDIENEKTILQKAGFTYPVIIKLTGESCGVGISNDSVVYNEADAIKTARLLIKTYRQGVIIESFLPGNDITAARFVIDGEALHLTTHYQIENKAVLGYEERKIPWGKRKKMTQVKESFILEQIDEILPKVWKALDVKDIIRLDGKLDANGQFRVFDVNGFPGLIANSNTFPVQCNVCFSRFPDKDVYRAMVNTIVLSAARRYQITIPKALEQNNLFSMKKSLINNASPIKV